MNAAVTTLPIVQDLNRLLAVLMIMNVLLVGLVILFAWRCVTYRQKLEDLERANACGFPPPSSPSPLSDDKLIPAARDTRKATWKPPV